MAQQEEDIVTEVRMLANNSNDLKHFDNYHPVDDIREHSLDGRCKCAPSIDRKLKLIIHNSFDCREMYQAENDQGDYLLPKTIRLMFYFTSRSQ